MGIITRAIGDKTLQQLGELRCTGCRRLLCRISSEALRPNKVLEVKCPKCDFFSYEIGKTS